MTMKRFTLILFILLITSLSLFSQQKSIKPSSQKKLNYLGKSQPLKNIKAIGPGTKTIESKKITKVDPFKQLTSVEQIDPVMQSFFGSHDSIKLLQNFDGLHSINMPNPDTEGDVGPNHYFQIVKRLLAIWDKTGNLLYGPVDLSTLWSDFQGPWLDMGWTDPIVLYDHLNDRWLASSMVYEIGVEYYEMIAVSATSDPLGEWHCYSLWFDVMPDYPKFGIWPDGYYLTINEFSIVGSLGIFEGASIFVFNPEELINGITDPTVIYFHFDAPNNSTTVDIASFQPSDLDGDPPPPGTPNYHICVKDDKWGYEQDRIWIWECVVDWADTSNCHFSEVDILETSSFDSNYDNMEFIHQPYTPNRLHSLSHFLMFRLQYRKFEGYQAMVCNHTVDVDESEHAGVRWFELRNEGEGWFINQQSSYAPDENSRWMGSLAMDADGNIGLGYSVSSDQVFPSIRVTGRRFNDVEGIMTLGELEIATGAGNQGWNPRWGDYSMMAVDPVDDLTFWYTQEYLPIPGPLTWQTKIVSFQLHKNATLSKDSLVFITFEDCINGKILTIKNESQFDIEFLDIESEGMLGSAMWQIDPFNFEFPFMLNCGDSIELNLMVLIPLENIHDDFITDTLNIITDYKNYEIPISLNKELLAAINTSDNENDKDIIKVFPNPFNSIIAIELFLKNEANVKLEVFDNNQRKVISLFDKKKLKSGIHKLEWNGKNYFGSLVSKGIYYIHLEIEDKEISKKIIRN